MDTETGNDDFGARYYFNRFGRWLSADWSSVPVAVPYANPQTLNLYAMVSDDPETFSSFCLRDVGHGRAKEHLRGHPKDGMQIRVYYVYSARHMNLTAERLLFFLGALGVPGIVVILNFLVRGVRGWYYTAGTDFLLAQMTFSFSSAILSKDMAPYIQSPYIREAANGIFSMLGLIILLVWIWTAWKVEKEIHDRIQKKMSAKSWPQYKLFVSWGCVVTFFAVEIMAFVYR